MNREIKFRAYDKKSKTWADDETLTDGKMLSFWSLQLELDGSGFETYKGNYCDFHLDKKNIKIVQFTGLVDKNDKEIYEGNIILDDQVVEWITPENARPDQEAGCYGIQNGKYNLSSYSNEENFEVIGNKWENPELLKGDKDE